ncbi:MAG: RdgB/HAM1 family non-canonical purine NTP pyrophosphatase [Bacteroidota bacterium]
MYELVIASNNAGKIKEIRSMIEGIRLLSLKDIEFEDEIPEPYHTFEENACMKAMSIHHYCGKNVFADDSGICVNALNAAPGVNSAHYSGKRDDEQNLQKVLQDLYGHDDRSAYYKAIICLVWQGTTHYFEGVCNGTLLTEKRGTAGFGYDPIFVPDGNTHTFAELPLEVKNTISHRGIAVRKMIAFLKEKTHS